MKGVKITKPWEIGVVELSQPEPRSGAALIKVRAAGICGSDIGAFRGVNPLVSYPRIIGHEIAGEVLEIAPNSKGIKAGDHVIVDPYLYCGKCYPCSIGRTNCCENLKVLGVHVEGGMVEYFTHPQEMLYKVPEDLPWELIPLAEPLTIALHGLHRSALKAGEHIAISGAGPIGLLAAMSALTYQAIPIVIDPVAERLDKAQSLGVSYVINPTVENLTDRVAELTHGRMVEVMMEASGANTAIQNSLAIVAHAGRIAFTGWPKGDTSLTTGTITKKEVDIRGARTSAGEFGEAIDLIYQQKIDVRNILTTTVKLDDAAQMVQQIEKDPGNYLKVNVLM